MEELKPPKATSNHESDHAEKPAAKTDRVEETFAGSGPLTVRSLCGGVLMGLANLVPGISGGTMLLAAGIYPQFIDAVADVTRLRFRFRSILILGCVVAAAGLSILLLAGVVKGMVVANRWAMYSLFIGLTLGGVPIVWRLAKPASTKLIVAAVCAFLTLVGLAILKAYDVVGSGGDNIVMRFVAGLAGASAMILPGLSGSYLLMLMGQYLPILDAIDVFKEALKARDIGAAMDPALNVVLPVGIGVVVGVVLVGNLLKWLMREHRKATLGVLLGLLIGSTVGLFPFQRGVKPEPGMKVKGGREVTVENLDTILADLDEEDYPTQYFRPSAMQVASSLGLIVLGFGITMGIAKVGGEEEV